MAFVVFWVFFFYLPSVFQFKTTIKSAQRQNRNVLEEFLAAEEIE